MKALIIGLIFSASASALAQGLERTIFGTWKITQVADGQDSTSISDQDAAATIGMPLQIGLDGIRFGEANCAAPVFTTTRRRSYSYFVRQFNLEPKRLQLPDNVLEIEVKCQQPVGINFIYIRDKNRLVFYWEGFFLNAQRSR